MIVRRQIWQTVEQCHSCIKLSKRDDRAIYCDGCKVICRGY